MTFNDIPSDVDFPAQEREVMGFWNETNAFEEMRAIHHGKPTWSFIDGPITANNPMGVHHGWGRTYKDLFLRYWTMKGRELRYQNGFDCQGLWVEVEVEKELGFTSKKDIESYGLAKFVLKCKERVLRYAAVMTEQSMRLGYWMDWNRPEDLRMLADKLVEDPSQMVTVEGPNGPVTDTVEMVVGRLGLPEIGGSYFTFSNENNYMIWTFLKKCWEKGWLYRGADVMPWCPRCATGISQHEIVTDGYKEVTHSGVTLRFPLHDRPGESLLIWTTTPWTLTSNVAVAVGPELTYVKVLNRGETVYLSKGTLGMLQGDFEVVAELTGKDLEGWTYDGPFDDLPTSKMKGGFAEVEELATLVEVNAVESHRVILWDEVGDSEGTGLVHVAPGCGAEDFSLGKELGLPLIAPISDEGYFLDGFDWLTGMHVSEVSQPIFENLEQKGLLYHVSDYTHRYPVCWRCQTELVFRLVDEWFISMGEVYDKPREQVTAEEKERSLRYQIMDVVDQIRWIPEFGYAREMDWLHNMHDWMISKKRYWGLSLPIWICEDCSHYDVIGDEQELEKRAVEGWEAFAGHSPHRPYIDAVRLECRDCGGQMTRIPDVGNPWLDAGIVGFSTLSYRSDPEYWRKWYPANWISESFPGQFRNWFYSMLAMGTVIDRSTPFLENFGYALLYAEDGRPMHKSWGNSIEFNEAADDMGVDVMRWLYSAHKPENNLLFGYKRGDEVRRQFLIPIWNVYNFLVTYAKLDGWKPSWEAGFNPEYPEGKTPVSDNLLDRWIVARLNEVLKRCERALDDSDTYSATLAVSALIDDLTNWYVRRSRRRFWKSDLDADKEAAYQTLYHVMVKMTRMLAPITPFFTEVIYQNLVRSVAADAYESIHHTSWPQVDEGSIVDDLLKEMGLARRVASLGLGARSSAGIKLRQPLGEVSIYTGRADESLSEGIAAIIQDELNVKGYRFVSEASALMSYRILPNNQLLGPKFGAQFPKVREALEALDPLRVAGDVQAERAVEIELDGVAVELAPDEILVQTHAAEGFAVSVDKGTIVAVDTKITPELQAEGLAREIVRRVQAMRKDAEFNIDDRITTFYQTEAELSSVVEAWADYIKAETLSLELKNEAPPEAALAKTFSLDSNEILLAVMK